MKKSRLPFSILLGALVFFYAPLAVLSALSFNDNYGMHWTGLSLRGYEELFRNQPDLWLAFGNSLIVALSAGLAGPPQERKLRFLTRPPSRTEGAYQVNDAPMCPRYAACGGDSSTVSQTGRRAKPRCSAKHVSRLPNEPKKWNRFHPISGSARKLRNFHGKDFVSCRAESLKPTKNEVLDLNS